MILSLVGLVGALTVPYIGTNPISLPAAESTAPAAILVLLQGAQIPNQNYVDLATTIQKSVEFPLNVILPDFPFDLVLPNISSVHDNVQNLVKNIPNHEKMPVFLAGHSLGAVSVFDEVSANPTLYKGALVFGASLNRKFNNSFQVPLLEVNPELDGLQRVSRVAEGFFNRFDRKKIEINSESVAKQAIVIVKGMNHFQFAGGNPPSRVRELDLKAEVADAIAKEAVAKSISNFLCLQHTGCDKEKASASLVQTVKETRQFLDPMIKSFKMEGSPNLFTACNSDIPSAHCPWYPAWPLQPNRTVPVLPASDCICGVPFSTIAAQTMANLDAKTYPFIHADAIHDVSDTNPYHHAHIWTNCTAEAKASFPCAMNSTTVSQPMYEEDKDESKPMHATAYEIRIKMKARQAYARFSYDPNANIDVLDAPSICADINQKSYEWALQNAAPETVARFKKYGQPIFMVTPDSKPVLPIGPLFINSKLGLDDEQVDGKWVLKVKSTAFKTPEEGSFVTNLYPDSNGYHYCKVLSPARAMEHIYVDGLRKNMGI